MLELFYDEQTPHALPGEACQRISLFLDQLLQEFQASDRSVCLMLCSDARIRSLNASYRSKDTATDVLSFPSLPEFGMLGDIAISIDTAREQAYTSQVSLEMEVLRLSVHGVLHLLGFDHETSPEDARQMFDIEDSYVQQFQTLNPQR